VSENPTEAQAIAELSAPADDPLEMARCALVNLELLGDAGLDSHPFYKIAHAQLVSAIGGFELQRSLHEADQS